RCLRSPQLTTVFNLSELATPNFYLGHWGQMRTVSVLHIGTNRVTSEPTFPETHETECLLRVCAVTRRRFPVGASPTRQSLQPEAIGAVMEVTKWLKPSISVSRIGDSASVQAATRVDPEQSSKRTMRRSTRQPYRGRLIRLDEMSEGYVQTLRRGSGGGMYTRKAHETREAPRRGQR